MKFSGLRNILIISVAIVCGCKSSSTAPQLFSMSGRVQFVDTTQSTYSNVVVRNAANVTFRLNNSDSTTTTDANGNFTFYDVPGNTIDGVTLSSPGYATSQLYIHVPDTNQHVGLLYPNSWLAASLGSFTEASDTEVDSVLVGFRDTTITDTTTGASIIDTLNKGTIEIDTLVHHNGFMLPVTISSMIAGRPAIGQVIFYISTADSINPLDPKTFDFTYNNVLGSDSSSTITEYFIINDFYQFSKLYADSEYTTGTKIFLRAYVSPYKNPRSYSYPGSQKPIYPFLGAYPSNSVSITLP